MAKKVKSNCFPCLYSRPRSVWNQNFNSAAHKRNLLFGCRPNRVYALTWPNFYIVLVTDFIRHIGVPSLTALSSVTAIFRADFTVLRRQECNIYIVFIIVLCLAVSCGNKTGKKRSNVEKVRFFHAPRVIVNQGEYTEELTSERRRVWISAISRLRWLNWWYFITQSDLQPVFVSGEAGKDWDRFNVDLGIQNL